MPLKLKQHENGNWYVRGTLTVGWRDIGAVTQEIYKSTRTKDKLQADAIRRLIENQAVEQIMTGRKPGLSLKEAAAKAIKSNQNQLDLLAERMKWDNCTPASKAAFTPTLLDELFQKKSEDRSNNGISAKHAAPAAKKVRLPSKIAPVENPLSRAAQRKRRRQGRPILRLVKPES